jgi:hypothetical protein
MENQDKIVPYDSLPPYAKAQHQLAIIRRFLVNGFEGEHMYKKDQNIIDDYVALKSDDEKKEWIASLEVQAYTFD